MVPTGLCAFPLTPANHDGTVDSSALRNIIEPLAAAQVHSIGVLGSTGSYMYLNSTERRRALETALDAAGTIPVVVGVGALRTDDAVHYAQTARAAGAAQGLLAAVSYAPLTDEEVFEHFATVAREGGLPICIYDNPSATHFSFSPALVRRLSALENIVAIKSPATCPSSIAAHFAELQETVPAGFSVGYSRDWYAVEGLLVGASTWHSVLGGIFPQVCMRMTNAARQGNRDTARRLNAQLEPIWALFREFGSLRVVYAIAGQRGLCAYQPPRPVLPLAEKVQIKIANVLAQLPQDIL